VDDVRKPREWEWMSGNKETSCCDWARDYETAIQALATNRYHSVSLDFCLEDTDPRHTGLDVAKWILQAAEAGTLHRMKLYIHSMHPQAREMYPYLRAAEQSWKAKEPPVPEPEPGAFRADPDVAPEILLPRICRCGAEIKNPGRFCDDCAKSFKRKHKKPRR
jgi:hypothetical protein